MAVVNATPGDPLANSYATIAEPDSYHETGLDPSAWTAATEDQKTRALISATRLLDTNVTWQGRRATIEQALDWPRYFVHARDARWFLSHLRIAQDVKNATRELAGQLIVSRATPTSE